ncbi:MAG: hypothetical protein KJ714_06485, partial [Euryarchaeota archaeon]|nr:hypothetical protein [Euryarchaeota archaeon]
MYAIFIILVYPFGFDRKHGLKNDLKGKKLCLSDIDIGILYSSRIDTRRKHNLKLKLIGEIASKF